MIAKSEVEGTKPAVEQLLKDHDRYRTLFALSTILSIIFLVGISFSQMQWSTLSSVSAGCALLTGIGALYHHFKRKKIMNLEDIEESAAVQWNPLAQFFPKKT